MKKEKKNSFPTRKELLSMPFRKTIALPYYHILLVPAGTKHDSGYMHIAVVGVRKQKKGSPLYQIAAYPDDICWDLTGLEQKYPMVGLRTDCEYPSGIIRIWGRGKFEVEFPSFSSTDIKFIPDL